MIRLARYFACSCTTRYVYLGDSQRVAKCPARCAVAPCPETAGLHKREVYLSWPQFTRRECIHKVSFMEGEGASREVCQFYVAGKCRFGEECRNEHPAGMGLNSAANNNGAKRKAKKRQDEKPSSPKRGMKTAMDVIK